VPKSQNGKKFRITIISIKLYTHFSSLYYTFIRGIWSPSRCFEKLTTNNYRCININANIVTSFIIDHPDVNIINHSSGPGQEYQIIETPTYYSFFRWIFFYKIPFRNLTTSIAATQSSPSVRYLIYLAKQQQHSIWKKRENYISHMQKTL
jgi:hypothetical protein